jgi:hypothetical protein
VPEIPRVLIRTKLVAYGKVLLESRVAGDMHNNWSWYSITKAKKIKRRENIYLTNSKAFNDQKKPNSVNK